MIDLETQHFKLNRFLLLIIGLWPLQQSNLTRFQFIVLFNILMTSIIFQLMSFVTLKCTPDLIINVLSSFLFSMPTIKDLLMQLQDIYDRLKDKNEIDIVKEYSYNAKRFTIVLTIFSICGLSFIIIISWSSVFYPITYPINVTQTRHLPMRIKYFIDQEKYFLLILLHFNATMCIGMIAVLAIGAMLITYLQHTCGMFRISSYRIKRAMQINTLENIKMKKENLILKGIISAVDMHRQAMKLSGLLVSKIQTMIFCLIIIGVIILSLSFFRVNQSFAN
ncbi:uncharacterized protein LOC109610098 [Camponotus floridanus]|uniref:uncharacterized protein LOC109610098 n=1 Tax=Camponotus floridanus TaxID=104421 RepID=UPI000DC69A5F|nr:uncharacterized protein LOC109610098 [Camponotus floridanus]